MTYSTEEYKIYLQAREAHALYKRLQSEADRSRHRRLKAEAEEDSANKRRQFQIETFKAHILALQEDIHKTIPIAYGNHYFTTQVRWDEVGDDATLIVHFHR